MTVQKAQQQREHKENEQHQKQVIESANTKTLTCGTHFADRCGRKTKSKYNNKTESRQTT